MHTVRTRLHAPILHIVYDVGRHGPWLNFHQQTGAGDTGEFNVDVDSLILLIGPVVVTIGPAPLLKPTIDMTEGPGTTEYYEPRARADLLHSDAWRACTIGSRSLYSYPCTATHHSCIYLDPCPGCNVARHARIETAGQDHGQQGHS